MQNADLQSDAAETGMDSTFKDTRTHLTTRPEKASRRHASSPIFVAGILDSYVQTKRSDAAGVSSIELYDTAGQHMAAARVNQDPFIKKLLDSTGKGGMFTYSELLRIDPTIDSRKIIAPLTPALRATLHQAGQTQGWQGSDYETQFATTLSQAVPGYMLDNNFQSIRFRATNDGAHGIIVHIVDYGSLMQGIDISPFLASFTFAVQNTLLKDLTYNNQISFTLEMSCNLIGDTKIELSLNGGPVVPYASPCFCDHLFTPMLTADFGKFNALAHDLSIVVDYLGDATAKGTHSKFIDNTNGSYI
jgi:hypothetical protein